MNWQEFSDRKLVELCQEGNEDAWTELLRRYKRLIASVASRTLRVAAITPAPSLVEDLISDTLMRIVARDFRALRELRWLHDGSLRGLLQVTTITATKDWIRSVNSEKRDRNKEESLSDLDWSPPVSRDQLPAIEQKILMDQLTKCLETLLHHETDYIRDMAIFRLFYSYRITAADLARVYAMNLRKVENTLARLSRLVRSHCL